MVLYSVCPCQDSNSNPAYTCAGAWAPSICGAQHIYTHFQKGTRWIVSPAHDNRQRSLHNQQTLPGHTAVCRGEHPMTPPPRATSALWRQPPATKVDLPIISLTPPAVSSPHATPGGSCYVKHEPDDTWQRAVGRPQLPSCGMAGLPHSSDSMLDPYQAQAGPNPTSPASNQALRYCLGPTPVPQHLAHRKTNHVHLCCRTQHVCSN
jgi:hypothetical protein